MRKEEGDGKKLKQNRLNNINKCRENQETARNRWEEKLKDSLE